VYLAGAKKLQPPPYLAIGTSRTFPEIGGSGIRQLAMHGGWPHHCLAPGATPCYFESSRLCGSMHPSFSRLTTFAGGDQGQALKNNAGLWGHPICSAALLRLQQTPRCKRRETMASLGVPRSVSARGGPRFWKGPRSQVWGFSHFDASAFAVRCAGFVRVHAPKATKAGQLAWVNCSEASVTCRIKLAALAARAGLIIRWSQVES